ncbi:MAG: OmpA family protein [bacterium]|mgnify:FL=1|jgi:outer membrane protein OmpA-like peptidoglycan-associated protein|nr:MAG: hypothetical protein DIU52_04805 [bacterium]
MTRNMRRNLAWVALAAVGSGTLGGCAWSNTAKGAVIGAGAGAAAGAAVGKATGSTARGAILGAAVGGTAGALIGRRMDQQAERLAKSLPNAKVERVGEGILVTFDSGILFDFDSAELRPEARTNLANLARSLQEFDKTSVLLVGHTDSVGSEEYNQRLSERRARAAAEFLIAQGVSRDRIVAIGRGELEPVASNDDEWGRQQNRRVEVAIYASDALKREVGAI